MGFSTGRVSVVVVFLHAYFQLHSLKKNHIAKHAVSCAFCSGKTVLKEQSAFVNSRPGNLAYALSEIAASSN